MSKFPETVVLEDANCPNGCEKNDKHILCGFDRLHGIEGDFNIVQCLHCGLERTNPRPTADTIGIYYPNDYAPYQSHSLSIQEKNSFKKALRKLIGFEFRVLPNTSGKRMLEIGCSSGNYMEEMRVLGWDVDGIEYSESAANIARTKGFNVQVSSLEKASPPKEKYDVITGWMVLEHLHEPILALKKASEWIKPNGYLVLSVPDAQSVSRSLFKQYSYDLQLPSHLFHYTPKTLETILNNAGWEIEQIRWQKNANTLLKSIEYWASDRNKKWMLRFIKWFGLSRSAIPLRLILAWLLGVTHQSGRIEVWAKLAGKR